MIFRHLAVLRCGLAVIVAFLVAGSAMAQRISQIACADEVAHRALPSLFGSSLCGRRLADL
jgi:hypothetical protein